MDTAREQIALYDALLTAASSVALRETPAAIMRSACDALITASPCIQLAWMYFGEKSVQSFRPAYAIGPARKYTDRIVLDMSSSGVQSPVCKAWITNEPVIAVVETDPGLRPWKKLANAFNLKALMAIPIGEKDITDRGIISIYSDIPDYFDSVGSKPFRAFTDLAKVAIKQTFLKNRLKQLASFDSLTHLLNRTAMQEILLEEHNRSSLDDVPYCLILMDVDHFKAVNDRLGHDAGDLVLVEIAKMLRHLVRDGDTVCRWGGEEFLILLANTDEHKANQTAQRLIEGINTLCIELNEFKVETTMSAGIATYPEDGKTLEELLKKADAALYEAKKTGRNRVIKGKNAANSFANASELNRALTNGFIHAAYQPIVNLETRKIVAMEALARMVNGIDPPQVAATFIHAASELHLLHRIDEIIMKQALATFGRQEELCYFINISVSLLRHPETMYNLLESSKRYHINTEGTLRKRSKLVIEINEGELLEATKEAGDLIKPLLDHGFQIALDNFGNSNSSFRLLADLPVNYLKIEGQLIQRMAYEPRVKQLVKGINAMAKGLDLITIAEFVEDQQTAIMLNDIGIDWAQGYYFGKPQLSAA
ncbi:MAG TPA: bifunctional diguanylate cyclase/phosphodiesterase [Burkholderiales bacterium]|nr:bifunctional diguanylate cyclase/phosphodiesterase [Burkholderiales bacterium]